MCRKWNNVKYGILTLCTTKTKGTRIVFYKNIMVFNHIPAKKAEKLQIKAVFFTHNLLKIMQKLNIGLFQKFNELIWNSKLIWKY